MMRLSRLCTVVLAVVMVTDMAAKVCSHDYADALTKCLLFFEGQRSGKLPPNQRMSWRKDSALRDGSDKNVDLEGGYYDAGDNVKFNFPMAFTTTMVAWSVLEVGKFMGSDAEHAREAVRWGADYLMKSTSVPGTVYVQVGNPYGDHNCWERPEDMDTPRTSYAVTSQKPGSEVSAEIAAALAASALVFRSVDRKYSAKLLTRAKVVFAFADKYRGSYNDSLGPWVCPFYCDWNGYQDELIWGAAWLYKATNQSPSYLKYILDNIPKLHLDRLSVIRSSDGSSYSGFPFAEFGWDAKHAGINILLSKFMMSNSTYADRFIPNADRFICSVLPDSPSVSVAFSPGGLMFKPGGSNMQHPTAISFLLVVYARYLKAANKQVHCGNVVATHSRLIQVAKGQVDYILGSNPLKMSYVVGYGKKYPKRIHHRGSTLPSVRDHPKHIGCHDGTPYFETSGPNRNMLIGAIPGGPDSRDWYADSRSDFVHSEPTTYINAPFVGALAYFRHHSQLRPSYTSSSAGTCLSSNFQRRKFFTLVLLYLMFFIV